MAADRDIVKDWNERYQYSWESMNPFFSIAERNVRFYLGDQWTQDQKERLAELGRTASVVNQILPAIKMITGYQRKHRLSSVAVPVEPSDQLESDQLTQLLLYFFTTGSIYEDISDAFEGALYSGMNMVCPYIDYTYSPEGTIKTSREPYNSFVLDPFFSKKDLSDCGYLMRRKYIDSNEAVLMLPRYANEVKKFLRDGGYRDDKFVWLPYQQIGSSQPMIAFDEYWERKNERVRLVLDTFTGNEYKFESEEELYNLPENFQIISKLEPYVLRHILLNGNYITTQKNPDGYNDYPFVPFFCLWYPEQASWSLKCQSLVNLSLDAQIESNKRRSQMTDFYESQLTNGWIATDGSVVDPRSLYQTGQGSVIWRKKGSEPGDLQRIEPPQMPPGLELLKQTADADIKTQMGVSDELLGQQDTEDDSGLKVALRQSAALVGLQPYMDNLRYAQKILTKKIIGLIPAISPLKLSRILGKPVSQKLLDQRNLKCDVNIEEGLLTTTQKEMFFRQVVALQQLGVPTPPSVILRNAPIQGKSEYYEEMEKFEKAQSAQAQQQAQIQQSLLESEQKLAHAQAIYDVAKAKSEMADASKTRTEEVQVYAKAADDRADAVLRRIESLKRLDELDLSKLERMIGLLDRLEAQVKETEQEIEKESEIKDVQQEGVVGGVNQSSPAPLS